MTALEELGVVRGLIFKAIVSTYTSARLMSQGVIIRLTTNHLTYVYMTLNR